MVSSNQPQSIGKYEILSLLGRGGMGVVYKARDPHIDRIVAIKTIVTGRDKTAEDDLLSRLRQEARSAGRLHHPNVVTIFDFGEQDDIAYIVMEYVEGLNLGQIIDERRPLGLTTRVEILLQIAAGLAYAHEHGVIHRDMKPGNVCVTHTGMAKVLDFGLARVDSTKLTRTGYMSGTIAYMSPERFSGVTGIQDDVFALGAIAYELLTYERAFPGSAPPEIISKILTPGDPIPPSQRVDLPPPIDEVVMKALAKSVEVRYRSASEFAHDLRKVAHSQAFHEHVSDPQRMAVLEAAVAEFTARHQTEGNAYAGPDAVLRDFRTRPNTPRTFATQASPDVTAIDETEMWINDQSPPGARRTAAGLEHVAAGEATVIERLARRPRWGVIATVAALLFLVAAVLVVRLRKPTPVSTASPVVEETAAPVVPNAVVQKTTEPQLSETSALLLATASSLAEELNGRSLNREERLRLSEAKALANLAEQRFKANDPEAGARLIANAVAGMRSVLEANAEREAGPAAKSAGPGLVASKRTTPASPPPVIAQKPPTVAVNPPTVPSHPEPEPVQPSSAPAPASTQPAEPDPEREIQSLMNRLAGAYQSKNVGFFRENTLNYTEQLGNAIRNSPSVRVSIDVGRIDVQDPRHATVHLKRTDVFSDDAAPPAVQQLVYRLEKTSDGWKIASIGRQ